MIGLLIYVPFLANIFHHGPIDAVDWAYLLALVPTLLVADEIRKFFVRRRAGRVVREVKREAT